MFTAIRQQHAGNTAHEHTVQNNPLNADHVLRCSKATARNTTSAAIDRSAGHS